MSGPQAAVVATTFVWLGMVLAISFLETPLKFRAPDVTLRIGLGIGRLVFRALNAVETVLALVVVLLVVFATLPGGVVAATVAAAILLAAQVAVVRPALSRRTARVLAGEDGPRSRAHLAYVGLESLKVLALIALGAAALAGAA